MSKYFILLILLFANCHLIAIEQIDLEKRYIETMALTFQAFTQEESQLIWPGFTLNDRPVVFHFQNGHLYAFGLRAHSPVWERGVIQNIPVLFSSRYPHVLPPLHPAFPMEREKAFVISLDHGQETSFLPLLTFIHERFHLYQFRFFYKEKVVEAELANYQNADLLAWIEIENRLLTSFLQTEDEELKRECLKNYLAVSQIRRQLLHPTSIKWEDHQQKMEGLADYVSLKTFQTFPSIPDFKAEEFLLEMRQRKNSGIVTTQDALKGRHYFVGATLAWALDFCNVIDWKWRVEKKNVSLHQMLEEALPMSDEEKEARSLHLQQAFDWGVIRQQIEEKLESDSQAKKEIVQAFAAQEGVIIRMGTPSGSMSAGGRHQKSYQVDRQKALIADTSVATSQDQTWTLRFHAIPLIFEEPNGDRLFKLSPDTVLQLNGEEISLHDILEKEQKEHPFLTLSLKHPHCELNSQRAGKLCVEEDGFLSLQFH